MFFFLVSCSVPAGQLRVTTQFISSIKQEFIQLHHKFKKKIQKKPLKFFIQLSKIQDIVLSIYV